MRHRRVPYDSDGPPTFPNTAFDISHPVYDVFTLGYTVEDGQRRNSSIALTPLSDINAVLDVIYSSRPRKKAEKAAAASAALDAREPPRLARGQRARLRPRRGSARRR